MTQQILVVGVEKDQKTSIFHPKGPTDGGLMPVGPPLLFYKGSNPDCRDFRLHNHTAPQQQRGLASTCARVRALKGAKNLHELSVAQLGSVARVEDDSLTATRNTPAVFVMSTHRGSYPFPWLLDTFMSPCKELQKPLGPRAPST